MCKGMCPHPKPALRKACFAPKSARRQVNGDSTPKSWPLGQRGSVGENQLHLFADGRGRDHAAPCRQGVRRTDDRHQRNIQQWLRSEFVRHDRHRTDDANAAASIQNRLDDGAEGFHVETQWRMRIGLSTVRRRSRQRLHRVHHVHDDRELGLKALAHRAGPGLESVHVVGH